MNYSIVFKNYKLQKFIFISVALIAGGFISACSRVNSDALEFAVATPAKKRSLLNERVAEFHRRIYWGDASAASQFVQADYRSDFYRKIKKIRRNEHLVDIEVDDVQLDDDGNGADVDVIVRYYKTPHYVIKTRNEIERWSFNRFAGGWVLIEHSIEELDESESAHGMLGDRS